MTPLLRASDVSKSYGSHRVLKAASLIVQPGEIVVVLGSSGSGKTTLFRCLTRLTEPDGGSIELDGMQLVGL